MTTTRTGKRHLAKKRLFERGMRRGFLTVQEIESTLPSSTMNATERWLLYYSLNCAQIGIRDETGEMVSVPSLSPEESERLHAEQASNQKEVPSAEVEEAEDALGALDHNPAEHP